MLLIVIHVNRKYCDSASNKDYNFQEDTHLEVIFLNDVKRVLLFGRKMYAINTNFAISRKRQDIFFDIIKLVLFFSNIFLMNSLINIVCPDNLGRSWKIG